MKAQEIDTFEIDPKSLKDSVQQTLTGKKNTANLILMYSFSKNDCSRDTPLNFSSSAGKQRTVMQACVLVYVYMLVFKKVIDPKGFTEKEIDMSFPWNDFHMIPIIQYVWIIVCHTCVCVQV